MLHPLYHDIYALLDFYGVRSGKRLAKVRNKANLQHDIDLELCEIIQQHIGSVHEWFNSIDGVRLRIDVSAQGGDLDLVVKKAILFGTITVCPLGSLRIGDSIDNNAYVIHDREHWARRVPENFYRFLLKYRPAIRESLLAPIPTSFTIMDQKKPEVHRPTALFEVSLSQNEVRRQLTEVRRSVGLLPAGTVDLYAPQLKSKSLETIVALRVEENEAYYRFQQRLLQLLQISSLDSSDQDLLGLMQATHEGIMELQSRLDLARKRLSRSVGATALGLAAASLCVAAPEGIAKAVATLLGTGTVVHGLTSFGHYHSAKEEIKKNDFYIPWRLSS